MLVRKPPAIGGRPASNLLADPDWLRTRGIRALKEKQHDARRLGQPLRASLDDDAIRLQVAIYGIGAHGREAATIHRAGLRLRRWLEARPHDRRGPPSDSEVVLEFFHAEEIVLRARKRQAKFTPGYAPSGPVSASEIGRAINLLYEKKVGEAAVRQRRRRYRDLFGQFAKADSSWRMAREKLGAPCG